MLAGGINAGNLKDAVRAAHATAVDVSSGVETSPGIKDAGMIAELLGLARTL
jgi:phosphoribosylanthranilate isomerase